MGRAAVVGEDVERGAERRVAGGRVLEEGGQRAVGGNWGEVLKLVSQGLTIVFGSSVLSDSVRVAERAEVGRVASPG